MCFPLSRTTCLELIAKRPATIKTHHWAEEDNTNPMMSPVINELSVILNFLVFVKEYNESEITHAITASMPFIKKEKLASCKDNNTKNKKRNKNSCCLRDIFFISIYKAKG